MSTTLIITGRDTRTQLKDVVRLHRQELRLSFLSSLGERSLLLLFEFAAENPSARLLVALNANSRVIGFLLGSIDTSLFYRQFIRRKSLRAALILAPKLLSSPSSIKKILETLLYPTKKKVRALPPAELMDLVVDSTVQRSGIGRALFSRFVQDLAESHVPSFRITTGESLAGAHSFYEKMGAIRASDIEIHANKITRVYTYTVQALSGGCGPDALCHADEEVWR